MDLLLPARHYENRLQAVAGNNSQVISGNCRFSRKSLAYVDVEHRGNTNYSMEEIGVIKKIVDELINNDVMYTVFDGEKEITGKVTKDCIKIISPYNAQVHRLKQEVPDISIGTVDKFQGQEAPIVIYSVTTSSPEDAPRGMDFLYSGNRLNVAVSRAECLFIMVANKKIFEPNCNNPYQIKLANSYYRYLELATTLSI